MAIDTVLLNLKEAVKNNKKQVVVLCAACILLFILLFTDTKTTETITNDDHTQTVYGLEKKLEDKLEEFLKTVDGVGKVSVCVSFDVLEQKAYAQNIQTDQSENDIENSAEYVIIETENGQEDGLALTVYAPKIRGVAVCCEGAGSQKVKNEVTQLLTAALHLPANRIYVSVYAEEK